MIRQAEAVGGEIRLAGENSWGRDQVGRGGQLGVIRQAGRLAVRSQWSQIVRGILLYLSPIMRFEDVKDFIKHKNFLLSTLRYVS